MTTEFSGYLTAEQVSDVHDAAVKAQLGGSDDRLDALVAGLPDHLTKTLSGGGPPDARLSTQLHELNQVHNLRDGTVPLLHWLQQAIHLAGDDPQVDVLEEAVDQVSHVTSEPPPALASDVHRGFSAPARGGPIEALPAVNTDILPEAMVAGSDQPVAIAFVEGALASARSVVKLLVHRHEDGAAVFDDGDLPRLTNGTGWFVGPDLVITNHHVINARRSPPTPEPDASPEDFQLQAEHTEVIFDYLEEAQPSVSARTAAGALLASDKDLDFAILRVPHVDSSRAPLRLRRHTIRKRPEQALGTRVNVLQHPNGNPMRLGFRDNFVVVGDDDGLSYLTDTQFGSSGSPVCDDHWFVAALHSGSRNISAAGLEIRGHKVRRENYGIPMPRILGHLERNHLELHQEILDAQPQR